MRLDSSARTPSLEESLESLQDERSTCVAHLTAMLAADQGGQEIERCMARIGAINAALIRLASGARRSRKEGARRGRRRLPGTS